MLANKVIKIAAKGVIVSLFFAAVAAHAYNEPSTNQLRQQLTQAKQCCNTINDFSFLPLELDSNEEFRIDQRSPAFTFATGKSYFVPIALPQDVPTFSVFLKSRAKTSVFAPSVMLLDGNKKLVRVIPAAAFQYKPAAMLEPDSLDVTFTIERSYLENPNTEYYMVILTTAEDMAGQTKMLHPAKLAAKRSHTVPPAISDPIAQHSPGGLIKVELRSGAAESNADFVSRLNQKVTAWFGGDEKSAISSSSPETVQTQTSQSAVNTQTPEASVERSTEDEMEAFYNQLILAKVEARQLDSAMALVEKAERAGSKTARQTFINAVQKLK